MQTATPELFVSTLFATAVLAGGTASAHTRLLEPNGGESLEVGSIFEVTWRVEVEHRTENWDLWYSTSSADGPWTPIALDLPAGDTSGGSVHTHAWTLPDDVDASVWVRVRQDNRNQDYTDRSDAPFAIVATPCTGDIDGNGRVDIADLLTILRAWGVCPTEGDCPEDLDGSGAVDVGDVLRLLADWGPCS